MCWTSPWPSWRRWNTGRTHWPISRSQRVCHGQPRTDWRSPWKSMDCCVAMTPVSFCLDPGSQRWPQRPTAMASQSVLDPSCGSCATTPAKAPSCINVQVIAASAWPLPICPLACATRSPWAPPSPCLRAPPLKSSWPGPMPTRLPPRQRMLRFLPPSWRKSALSVGR